MITLGGRDKLYALKMLVLITTVPVHETSSANVHFMEKFQR